MVNLHAARQCADQPAHLLERVSPPAPQDMAHRKNLTAMEMVWQGSNSLEDATVFTGNFISGERMRQVVVFPVDVSLLETAFDSSMVPKCVQATMDRLRDLVSSGVARQSWTIHAWTSTMCRTGTLGTAVL